MHCHCLIRNFESAVRRVSSHEAKDRTIITHILSLSSSLSLPPSLPSFLLASLLHAQFEIYRFANTAAAPPATSAAVGIAANGPAPASIVIAAVMVAGVNIVAAETPLVNGASCTGVAPVNAGAWVMAAGSGARFAAMGLSTLGGNGQRDTIDRSETERKKEGGLESRTGEERGEANCLTCR